MSLLARSVTREVLASLCLALACSAHPEAGTPGAPATEVATSAAVAAPASAPAAASPAPAPAPSPPRSPVVVVSDPAVLVALEGAGLDIGDAVVGARARSGAELSAHAAYRTLVDAVAADLAADRRADPALGVGMKHAHRQLDVRWLGSPGTRFELIAVVNRLDRRPFAPSGCGEVRLVYRLAYSASTPTGEVSSRLPMTVNVVSFLPEDAGGGCASSARAWLRPPDARGEAEAAWLLSTEGPLAPERRAAWKRKSVELNFQSQRWPSTVRPSMGGHAEYVLRVFHPVEGAPFYAPAPLENTIDGPRVAASPALRRELVQWLTTKDTLARIDAGIHVIPEQFLATRAVSVAPHGLARRGNRPFASVLRAADLATVDLSPYRTISTPEALLRRLDTTTCPGCHQSRSLAGFHLLGVEPEGRRVDALEVPMSPHFHSELGRRAAYTLALAEGRAPEEARPEPERGAHDDGPGARCGLGDPGFAAWTCGEGLRCAPGPEPLVGVCVPAAGPRAGQPCEVVHVGGAADPRRDVARLDPPLSCGAGVCEASGVGFPSGMCSGGCASLAAGETCGGIPLLTDFNACLAAGVAFDRCLTEHTRPGALQACGFKAPCRDDYVCARGPGGGACMPPYFLFQLRVDGHAL